VVIDSLSQLSSVADLLLNQLIYRSDIAWGFLGVPPGHTFCFPAFNGFHAERLQKHSKHTSLSLHCTCQNGHHTLNIHQQLAVSLKTDKRDGPLEKTTAANES